MANPGEKLSENIHRNTPASFVRLVRKFDRITLDPCSNASSVVTAKIEWWGCGPWAPEFLDHSFDGLLSQWEPRILTHGGIVYMNPPYGLMIKPWILKARREWEQHHVETIALLPVRSDTGWWHDAKSTAQCLWKGRIAFPPLETGAMFASAVLYWGSRTARFQKLFARYGEVSIREESSTEESTPTSWPIDPLSVDCSECSQKAGQACRNYRNRGCAPHRSRGKAARGPSTKRGRGVPEGGPKLQVSVAISERYTVQYKPHVTAAPRRSMDLVEAVVSAAGKEEALHQVQQLQEQHTCPFNLDTIRILDGASCVADFRGKRTKWVLATCKPDWWDLLSGETAPKVFHARSIELYGARGPGALCPNPTRQRNHVDDNRVTCPKCITKLEYSRPLGYEPRAATALGRLAVPDPADSPPKARAGRTRATIVQAPVVPQIERRQLRACLYHRVSTVDQNPTLARDELRAAAAMRGARVVLDLEETGSGARNDRPKLQQLLEAVRRNQLDIVIVWKVTRFGRSTLDLLSNVKTLELAGVRFVAVTQGLDVGPGGDATSKLILQVLAAVAEFERETIVDGTLLGMRRAQQEGIHVGRARTWTDEEVADVLELHGKQFGYKRIAESLRLTRSKVRRVIAAHNGSGV